MGYRVIQGQVEIQSGLKKEQHRYDRTQSQVEPQGQEEAQETIVHNILVSYRQQNNNNLHPQSQQKAQVTRLRCRILLAKPGVVSRSLQENQFV